MIDLVDDVDFQSGRTGIHALFGQSFILGPVQFTKGLGDIVPGPLSLVCTKKFRLVHLEKIELFFFEDVLHRRH